MSIQVIVPLHSVTGSTTTSLTYYTNWHLELSFPFYLPSFPKHNQYINSLGLSVTVTPDGQWSRTVV